MQAEQWTIEGVVCFPILLYVLSDRSDSGAARANPARVAPGVLNVFPEKVTFKPGAEGGVGIH